MERLTWKSVIDGHEDVGLKDGVSAGDAILQLAAYEDTGLEPEEIKEWIEAGKELFFERSDLYAKFGQIDHLLELAQAEKDGRLVVLPCKVGDTVYVTYGEGYITCVVDRMHIIANNQVQVRMRNFIIETLWLSVSEFGETVFLTRQEAEAALKKREEAGNEKSNSDRL